MLHRNQRSVAIIYQEFSGLTANLSFVLMQLSSLARSFKMHEIKADFMEYFICIARMKICLDVISIAPLQILIITEERFLSTSSFLKHIWAKLRRPQLLRNKCFVNR